MSFISINLFIFNLFPIPILDGGQILVLLIEGTLRRDLSTRIKERITQVGLVMIVMLMAMALYFDLSKNLPSLLKPSTDSDAPGVPGRGGSLAACGLGRDEGDDPGWRTASRSAIRRPTSI